MMPRHVRHGLMRGTAWWACFCALPMAAVVAATVLVSDGERRQWGEWGVVVLAVAFVFWLLAVVVECWDHRRRHGD